MAKSRQEKRKSRRRRRRWEKYKNRARTIRRWLGYWFGPIWFALALTIVTAGGIYLLKVFYPTWSPLGQGLYVEAAGAMFDILLFGVIIAFFIFLRDRRKAIERHQEEIDDFKKWDSEEARYRIAGAIRRLNRLGKTDIDFGGIELREFSFRRHDITNINGSTFYDGTWGTMGSRDEVTLEKVDFSMINCRNVVFSKFNPFARFGSFRPSVFYRDCQFSDADLSGAIFKGANLEWTEEHPEELGVWHDLEDGSHSFEQKHYPPFDGADLKGASFEDAVFKNVDFRNATNILECNFVGAKGLKTGLFDNDELKDAVIELAQRKKPD